LEPRADDDGTLADLPWASVFDPAVNVRALGEIQARGLRAAGDVVDRMVRAIDGDRASTTTRPAAATTEDGESEAETLLASWSALLRQLMESLGGALSDDAWSGAPSFDLGEGRSSGSLQLDVSGPGPVRSEVWVHNRTADDRGCLRLRCSDLLAHDGRLIPESEVGLEPVELPVPPRSSRGVEVTVDVPTDAASTDGGAAIYRGSLLVERHPDLWLPVVVAVGAPAA
jgi:hypothetical protein